MLIEIPKGAKNITLQNGMEIEVPQGAKTLDIPDDLVIPKQKEDNKPNVIDIDVSDSKPMSEEQLGYLQNVDVMASKPTVSYGDFVDIEASKAKWKAIQKKDGSAETMPYDADVGEEIGDTGVRELEMPVRPEVDALTEYKRGLLAKTSDTTTNVKNAQRVFEQGGYKLLGVKESDDGFAHQTNIYKLEKDGNEYIIDENSFSGALWDLSGDMASNVIALGTAGIGKAVGLGAVGNAIDQAISKAITGEELSAEQRAIEVGKEALLFGAGETVVKYGGKVIKAPKKLYDYLANGNIDGAKKILKDDFSVSDNEMGEALESASKNIKEDYTVGLTDKGKKQEQLLSSVENSPHGQEVIKDAIGGNYKASLETSKTIDKRSKNIIKTFDDVEISGTEIKKSVENYEKGVSKQFGDMRKAYREAFEDTDFRFKLEDLDIKSTLDNLTSKVTDPTTKEKFIAMNDAVKAIINDVSNGSGVVKDMDILLDIRQQMNKFYRKNSKAFELAPDQRVFKSMIDKIDDVVENGIKEYLPKDMHKPMVDLFDDARNEYSQMYKIADTKLYKSLMGDGQSTTERMDNLIKHTADDEKEFETLLKKLPFEDQQKIENSIIKSILNKNTVGGVDELQGVDYNKVMQSLDKMEEFFVTDSGKESVKLLRDMNMKFGRDLDLLQTATNTGVKVSTSIATSVEGKLKQGTARKIFDYLQAMVPFSDDAKRIALRNHIASALEKSRTPVDLAKKVLVAPDLPKSTKVDIRDLLAEHKKVLKIKNENDALKHQKEVEAKELIKQQKVQAIKDEIDNFKTPSVEEINAVESLTSSDRFGSFSHKIRNIQGGNPSNADIEDYVRAKADIDTEVLNSTILKTKYPISSDMVDRFEKLKNFDKSKLTSIVTENEYNSLTHHLKKNELPNTTPTLNQKYKDKFYELNKVYDENFGNFGVILKDYDYKTAVAKLKELKDGEAVGVLYHPDKDIGDIDLVWGEAGAGKSDGYGLAKLLKYHPEVIEDLPNIIKDMKVVSKSNNRIKLESDKYFASIRLEFDQKEKHWLLTAFEKEEPHISRTDIDTNLATKEMTTSLNSSDKSIIPNQTNKSQEMSFEEADKAGLIPFAKFGDNLLAGTIAGVQTDEDGNITGFDPEAFVVGIGGYTVAKQSAKYLIKKYKPQEKIANKIQKFIDDAEEDMAKMAGGGKPPIVKKDFKDTQGFYSVLEKVVDEKVGGKIDTVSLTKLLTKNGVKQDELEWSGLKELIESNDKLTKGQIEDVIQENRLVVEVVEKSEKVKKDIARRYHENGEFTTDEADKLQEKLGTSYEEYKIKGGDNYRELLFKQSKADNNYKSDHWEESNILVFTRVDDRVIDNKKSLFIEELQSDWHQAGRKNGYKGSLELDVEKLENSIKEKYGLKEDELVIGNMKVPSKEQYKLSGLAIKESHSVPNAPFKKNWAELGIKRLISEAVEKDYDKIAWTTGTQQAQRYSLEKQVDTIIYNKNSGFITGTNNGEEVIFKKVASDEEVEALMGKELTKRLIDPKSSTKDEIFVLQGDELKFGGDGMKAFYDNIVPNNFKKLFKKYKVKPRMEELDDVEEMVWSIDITDKMKADIKEYGQPLYMVGGTIIGLEAISENGDTK